MTQSVVSFFRMNVKLFMGVNILYDFISKQQFSTSTPNDKHTEKKAFDLRIQNCDRVQWIEAKYFVLPVLCIL